MSWYYDATNYALGMLGSAYPDATFVDSKRVFPGPEDPLIKGRRIDWAMTTPYVIEVPAEKIEFMEGNMWNFDHAAALLELIERGERPVFSMPAGRVYRIEDDDVQDTQEDFAAGELMYQRSMVRPWEPSDVGEFHAQLLDGNHRALAAIAAGEPSVPVIVSENYRPAIRPDEYVEPDVGGWWSNPGRLLILDHAP